MKDKVKIFDHITNKVFQSGVPDDSRLVVESDYVQPWRMSRVGIAQR